MQEREDAGCSCGGAEAHAVQTAGVLFHKPREGALEKLLNFGTSSDGSLWKHP